MALPVVGIVAGHGGSNRGTQAGGIDEATYTLAFCRDLAKQAKGIFGEQSIVNIRDRDEDLGLYEAALRAKKQGCSLVLAIHVNAFHHATLRGAAAFYYPRDTLGMLVGDAYLASVSDARARLSSPTPPPESEGDRWIQAPRNVVQPYFQEGMAAALLELFFASNPLDFKAGHSRWVRQRWLLGVMTAISKYYDTVAGQSVGPYSSPDVPAASPTAF